MILIRFFVAVSFLLGVWSCATSSHSKTSSRKQFVAANLAKGKVGDPMTSMVIGQYVPCCEDGRDFESRFGERVALSGVYNRTVVTRIRGAVPEDPDSSGAVELQLDKGVASVMLGIYYEAEGSRPVEEVKQFNGKRVTVYGVLHRNTPEQVMDGMVMQTMIGPYISVDRVELAP